MAKSDTLDADDQKDDPSSRLTQSAALVVLLLALPIYFAFDYAGYPGRARAAAICAAMIMLTVWWRWDLKNRAWFWATVVLLVLIHVPLAVMVPWTDKSYPGITLMPVAMLDLAVIYGIVRLVERLVVRTIRGKQGV